MGVAPRPPPSQHSFLLSPHTNHNHHSNHQQKAANSVISMSQGFHQGIFGFSDGFDRSVPSEQQQENQIRRDRSMRLPGYTDPSAAASLVPIEAGEEDVYGPAGPTTMLSDMLSFANQGVPSATELLASQMHGGHRFHRPAAPAGVDWPYSSGHRQETEMFLMNPAQQQQQQQQRSSSPPPSNEPFPSPAHTPPPHFLMGGPGGAVEGQGLSLSLSSSLQQFEMVNKAQEELRAGEGMLYYNSNPTSTSSGGHQQAMLLMQQSQHQGQQAHVGYGGGGPVASMNVLRHSRYGRAAQELLEEFCSVGRGHVKGGRGRGGGGTGPNPSPRGSHAGGASSSAGGSKDAAAPPPPPFSLSPADKFEHQRKKAKLLSMLDEVDRRYNHYCDQMQLVVNSFDSVMGHGAATPYTSLAQTAMSRHFRCLKDAIAAQLKHTCELLGDKDGAGGTGITKGETPRLRLLEQSLRQQRVFHQMGMMEQEAWRPQRGLPERSVNILRAWLFEHFLHPYPSDADKHMLARQTGLSRNQVTNWFINARVRLWKPMVEEMYQQEAKEEEEGEKGEGSNRQRTQTPFPQSQRTETNADDDTSHAPLSSSTTPAGNRQQLQQHQFSASPTTASQAGGSGGFSTLAGPHSELREPDARLGPVDDAVVANYATGMVPPGTQIMFGTSGDVSLTLGLRHAGSLPDNSQYSLRDFNG